MYVQDRKRLIDEWLEIGKKKDEGWVRNQKCVVQQQGVFYHMIDII